MGFDFARGGAIAATSLDDSLATVSDVARLAGGVDVDVNWTVLVQIVLFVLLFLALKPLLFDPMLRLFEEREKRIEGAKNEAREMYKEADEKIATYEAELVGVKRAAGEERDKLRAEGQRREQAILAKVRAETNALLEEGKARIAKDGDALRKELDATSKTLAAEIASRVLGREVS